MVYMPLKGVHIFSSSKSSQISDEIYIKSNLQRLPQSAPHCQHRHKRLHNSPTYADPKTFLFKWFLMIFHGYLFEEKKDDIVCQYYDSNSVTDSAIMGRDPCCQLISVLANCEL